MDKLGDTLLCKIGKAKVESFMSVGKIGGITITFSNREYILYPVGNRLCVTGNKDGVLGIISAESTSDETYIGSLFLDVRFSDVR